MGFSWSLSFCHGLLTEVMLEVMARMNGGCRDDKQDRLLQDRCVAPRLSSKSPIVAPYADNANMLCRGRGQAVSSLRLLREVLDEEQLRYRDVFEAVAELESVGFLHHGPAR